MTKEQILDKHHKLNGQCLLGIAVDPQKSKAILDAMEEYREQTIIEVKESLLKQMMPMTHSNNYPTLAVPHASILSLLSLM